jgi:hypothetical protein
VPVDDDIDKSFGADATSTSGMGVDADEAVAAHLAEMESREAMRQRAREELAAQVQREQCPFRPSITPTSRALAETRRTRAASAPRYAAARRSAAGSRSQSPPEPRSHLPPSPHDGYDVPGAAISENAPSSTGADDRHQQPPKRKLTKEEFAGFLAKQERHVRSHEAKVANAKTEVARRALAECTFQPHVNPSPTEPVYAVDGSVRRQPAADMGSPLSPVAVDRDDVGFHNNQPPPPGLTAHLRRQQQARQLRKDRAAMNARIAAGKNPHPAAGRGDETVVYLDDSAGSHDVSGGGGGHPAAANRRRPQSADGRLGNSHGHHHKPRNAGEAATRAAVEVPCVVPFSFDDHRVDPGTGDVHTTRELQDRDDKRRKIVGGAAYDRVSLAATARPRAASAARSADHGAPAAHHQHHDRSYGATSLSHTEYEESGHVVVRRSRSAVERAIKKFVGKDAVVRGGFLR